MPPEQIVIPSREEVVIAIEEWMRKEAPNQEVLDIYSLEDLVDMSLESIRLYATLWILTQQPFQTHADEIRNAIWSTVEIFKSIKRRKRRPCT